jgi:nicotinamide-nucleotide amidase
VKAAIVAVGTELLGTDRLDTNSLRLTASLRRYGVELVRKVVVGDDEAAIAAELGRLAAEVDLILVGGGLGPTADDVTREAVAALTGRALIVDEELVAHMRRRFRRLARPMPGVNRKQAQVVEGAEVLENRRGIAPGQRIALGSCQIVLLPGVPGELAAILESGVEPWLAGLCGEGHGIEERELRLACVPESAVEEMIRPAYEELGREHISVLAGLGEVKIRYRAAGTAEERRRRFDAAEARLQELLGEAVFSVGPPRTLEEVVGEGLRRAGATVATAESCTGGLLAERLTRTAGSSDIFVGGVVAYSNEVKVALLGVPRATLDEHGAVSQPVAEAMARGVREQLGSTFGVAITGVAGPGGGSEEKPVGTVHVALAGPGDGEMEHRRLWIPGDRERVRWLTSQTCLDLLRLHPRLAAAPAVGMRGAPR